MRPNWILLAWLTLSLCLSSNAWAKTQPISGAVALPNSLKISLPFEAGEKVRVSSGYGTSMGSSLHADTNAGGKANDHYALDLILPDRPNNGRGRPVLAIADGTIVKAGWGTAGWANYGKRVYIRHEPGDGHYYISLYAHLEDVNVSEGQKVKQGDKIGTLGRSCQQALECSSFSGPHVHFALHRDSKFEGSSGTQGSYGGNAVVPEPFDGHEDLARGMDLTSKNDGSGGSTGNNNPGNNDPGNNANPESCEVSPDAPTIFDAPSSCWKNGGDAGDWTDVNGGQNNSYSYVPSLAETVDYKNGVFWLMTVPQAGDYLLEVYIPSTNNLTNNAQYKIAYGGGTTKVPVDQNAQAGSWASLGTYSFTKSVEPLDRWVRLGDNTGTAGQRVVFDALRISPATAMNTNNMAGCPCNANGAVETRECNTCGLQSRFCDGCNWSDYDACDEPVDCAGQPPAEDPNDFDPFPNTNNSANPPGNPGNTTDDFQDGAEFGGSSCASSPTNLPNSPVSLSLLALLAILLRRRR